MYQFWQPFKIKYVTALTNTKIMLKAILLFISITAISLTGYTQSEDPVVLTEIVENDTYVIEFKNTRVVDTNKLINLSSRIESIYEEIASAEYLSDSNTFKIKFHKSPSEIENLEDMLSHFNLYNYTITK